MADEPSFHEEFADADNADSDEIADLHQKISDLEEENSNIIRENKDYMQRIKELTASVDELSADLKNQMDNKAFSDVADLEGEISRLHHDLQESKAELSGLKSELEAAEREKAVELDVRDKQIEVLKRNLEELEVVGRKGKGSDDLAMKMEEEISVLQRCLDEKERVIREVGENGGLRQREWMLVGGTAIATAAVMGCYVHAARKH